MSEGTDCGVGPLDRGASVISLNVGQGLVPLFGGQGAHQTIYTAVSTMSLVRCRGNVSELQYEGYNACSRADR